MCKIIVLHNNKPMLAMEKCANLLPMCRIQEATLFNLQIMSLVLGLSACTCSYYPYYCQSRLYRSNVYGTWSVCVYVCVCYSTSHFRVTVQAANHTNHSLVDES